jgi:TRAP-type C4-dicarboxylate transport system permease small subunit
MNSKQLLTRKEKVKKGFAGFEDIFSFYAPGILIVFLMFVMCTEICLRWFFNTSLMGVVEIVESAMVVIAFASLAGIQREKAHVSMTLMTDKLSGKKIGVIIEILTTFFILVMCGFLLHPFTLAVLRFKEAGEITEYMSIPLWMVGIFMPLGIFVLCIRLVGQVVGEGRKLFKPSDDPGV